MNWVIVLINLMVLCNKPLQEINAHKFVFSYILDASPIQMIQENVAMMRLLPMRNVPWCFKGPLRPVMSLFTQASTSAVVYMTIVLQVVIGPLCANP